MNLVIQAFVVAFLFYILLPLIGAYATRRRWRVFRQRILDASSAPIYPQMKRASTEKDASPRPDSGDVEVYRYFGDLEAVEDSDIIWLSDGRHRVKVDVKHISLFVLPGVNSDDFDVANERSPAITKWKDMGSLPEGTQFFVYGVLARDTLVPMFRSSADHPLMVIIHDVKPGQFLSRAIRTGRQRNEYWNSISPLSFLSGVMAQMIFIIRLLQQNPDSLMLLLHIPLALLPGIILMPPGIFLYFLYRKLWRKGRAYRQERDLLRLPMRYPDHMLPDGGSYLPQVLDGIPEYLMKDDSMEYRACMAEHHSSTTIWSYHPHHSNDPFAEHIFVKGNPAELAKISQLRAGRLEFFSLCIFFAGMALNLVLLEMLMLLFWF